MNLAFDAGLAGLRTAERGVLTAAGNIANFNTDGYRARRPDGSLRHDAPHFTDADGPSPSDVDRAEELIELKRHSTGYRASAAVIRAADRTLGALLDIFA